MQLVLFFTDSKRLSDIGVLLPWDSEKRLHQFSVIPENTGNAGEQQIWIVRDKIRFDELVPHLDAAFHLSELYYVYHSYPLDDFRKQLEHYLDKRKIFYDRQHSPHIANYGSTFEAITGYIDPFTYIHFALIVEKIAPCKKYVGRMLNQLDIRKAMKVKIKLLCYPCWVRDIYHKVMIAVTPENFELKRDELQTELERYCQSRIEITGRLEAAQ